MGEDVRPVQVIRRDLSAGENPWNGISEASDPEIPPRSVQRERKPGSNRALLYLRLQPPRDTK